MTAAERQAAREQNRRADLREAIRIASENSPLGIIERTVGISGLIDALDEKDKRIAELEALVGEDKLNLFSRLKNEQAKSSNRMTAGCRSCREKITELEAALNLAFGVLMEAAQTNLEYLKKPGRMNGLNVHARRAIEACQKARMQART